METEKELRHCNRGVGMHPSAGAGSPCTGSVSSLLQRPLFLSVVFYLSGLDNRANLAGQGKSPSHKWVLGQPGLVGVLVSGQQLST